ncbi:MAG: response regulator [Candidatus Omnitrophota bacterium]
MKEKTILLIDDEADFVEMIKFQLEAEGYVVVTANDGKEGLLKLKQIKPDLIVLDINMPNMGGLEFYNKIFTPHGRTKYPVLIVTARLNLEEIFKEIEVEGFLSKPFEINHLIAEIKRITIGGINPVVFLAAPKNSPHIKNITEAFVDERYDVIVCGNVQNLCMQVMRRGPHFILLEYVQKKEFENFLTKIKSDKKFRNMPVIVYSYSEFKIDETRLPALGINAFLDHPDDYGAFVEAVKEIQLKEKDGTQIK